jgi:hypothetical protein
MDGYVHIASVEFCDSDISACLNGNVNVQDNVVLQGVTSLANIDASDFLFV